MKSKCSFILKASLSLVLALLMLFGTVATSVAAVVDDAADTGAQADVADEGAAVDVADEAANAELAETGANRTAYNIRGDVPGWNSNTAMTVSTGGYYSVYQYNSTANASKYFCIYSGSSKTNITVITDGYWGSGGYTDSDSNNNIHANGSKQGEFYIWTKTAHTVYVCVYYPNTELNTSTTPEVVAYSSKPTDTATYYLYNNFANGSTFTSTSLGTTSGTGWDTKAYSTSITMPTASHDYAFKIYKKFGSSYPNKGDNWYGNTGKITNTISGWNFKTNENTNGNTTITSGTAANQSYTFSVTDSNWHDDSSYEQVTLAVTYPSVHTITVRQFKGTSGTTVKAGTVKIGDTSVTTSGGTATVVNNTATATKITAPTGYTVSSVEGAGWTRTSGDSGTSEWNGTVKATATATLTVRYVEDTKGVEVDVNTNGTRGTTGGNITIGGSAGAASGANTVNVGIDTSATIVKATENSGYSFTGWTISGTNYSRLRYSFNGSSWNTPTSNGMSIASTNTTLYIKTDGNSGVSTSTAVVTANFNSVYYLSAFDSYECPDGEHVKFITSPPRSITVTHGGTTYTYTYDGTMTKGNPDTGSDPEHSGTTTSNPDGIIAIGNNSYGAGNYIQVYGGDTVTLNYSSMASSEMIRGVFFNNDIQYRTVAPTAEQYVQHDYNPARTLYANSTYYDGDTATYIASQAYPLSDSNIDQSAHTVTFTATGNFKNIDIEIAAKRKVFFSDTTNAVIQSKNTEDYYYNGEALSGSTPAKYLTVKAAGSSVGQTNTINKNDIRIYEADAEGNPTENDITSSFTITTSNSAASISNSGGTSASSAYIKIDGTMPNNNIYIDLGVTSSFAIKLGSKIMSDFAGSWTYLSQPATVTAKSGSTTLLTAPNNAYVT